MTSRNYQFVDVDVDAAWRDNHQTCPAVASAIFAIADKSRTAEEIWAEPTPAEIDHIKMAIENYISCGDIEPSDDGRYEWGFDAIRL
ncbi:hypothetical protein [Methylocystis sp. S23]